MTPAQAIAKLDRALAKYGQAVEIRRGGSTATVQGFVRGYQPVELVGDVQQGDLSVVLSPTGLGGFPLPLRKNDKIVVSGAEKNVEAPEPVMMLDVLVRINVQVRGLMASFQTFDRDIKLATVGIAAENVSKQLASFAGDELARVIEAGEGSPIYTRYVDGVEGAPEESVDVRNSRQPGPIFYEFSWWAPIVTFALARLISLSPKRSGRFASSFVVIANSRLVTDYSTLKASDEVIITNAQPYVRKVQVGAMNMSVPPFLFDSARAAVVKEFGSRSNGMSFAVRFVEIGAGVHPLIPYRLRGEYAGRFNRQRARLRAGGGLGKGEVRLSRRKDRDVGSPLAYPALIMNLTVH